MLALRLPKDLEARLDYLTKTTARPKSFYVQEALKNYLGDLEDLYLSLERTTKIPRETYTTKELLDSLQNEEDV